MNLLVDLKSDQLIFIISQPRAGSTLLQKLLANAPEVSTSSEPWLLLPFLSVFRSGAMRTDYRHMMAETTMRDFVQERVGWPEYHSAIREMLLKLYGHASNAQFFLDKTPRYYEIIPQIVEIFPDARIVVLKRHPFDALHSMIETWSQGKFLPEAIAWFWRDMMKAPGLIQRFLVSELGNRDQVYSLKYEDMVSSPDVEIEKLFRWLQIPFKLEYLVPSGGKLKGSFGDDAYKQEVLTKISDKGLSKWKPRFNEKEYRSFFLGYYNHLGEDFFKQYGYSLEAKYASMSYNSKFFAKVMKLVGEPFA